MPAFFGRNGDRTGKTYVYMRTIFELSRLYGFNKFIIVVPSVAIREGGLKSIEITRKHFRALCNNVEFEHFIMPSKKMSKLRHFAVSNPLQILVINIDAFRKNSTSTDAENTSTWSGKPRAQRTSKNSATPKPTRSAADAGPLRHWTCPSPWSSMRRRCERRVWFLRINILSGRLRARMNHPVCSLFNCLKDSFSTAESGYAKRT